MNRPNQRTLFADDPASTIDSLMAFPGWASTRTDAWIDLVSSLDRHGPNGAVAVPSTDMFQVVIVGNDRDRKTRRAEEVSQAMNVVNARAMRRIGRPLVSMIVL